MDNAMDDLLTMLVEPPRAAWRHKMRHRHNMPDWTFPFVYDRFYDRFRKAEIDNNIDEFNHYGQSLGHMAFMKFWVEKTKGVWNWSNFLSWCLKSDVYINGVNFDNLCEICKRDYRSVPEPCKWRG